MTIRRRRSDEEEEGQNGKNNYQVDSFLLKMQIDEMKYRFTKCFLGGCFTSFATKFLNIFTASYFVLY